MARWEREENPALGWRAIRIALDRPALLRYQVRALHRRVARAACCASCCRWSRDVAEFNEARALIDREIERARAARPAAAAADPRRRDAGSARAVFMLPQIMRSADFVSIGSNDLLQFVFAVDRTNPRVAALRRAEPGRR